MQKELSLKSLMLNLLGQRLSKMTVIKEADKLAASFGLSKKEANKLVDSVYNSITKDEITKAKQIEEPKQVVETKQAVEITETSELKRTLESQLTNFKEVYLKKIEDWTVLNVERSIRVKREYFDAAKEYRSATPEERKEKRSQFIRLQNAYHTLKDGSDNLNYMLGKNLKHAERHFGNTLDKLIERIKDKGLNVDKVNVVTAFVGVNLSITLTDGDKTVRAFTIIASGEIQRPHYRYLIK